MLAEDEETPLSRNPGSSADVEVEEEVVSSSRRLFARGWSVSGPQLAERLSRRGVRSFDEAGSSTETRATDMELEVDTVSATCPLLLRSEQSRLDLWLWWSVAKSRRGCEGRGFSSCLVDALEVEDVTEAEARWWLWCRELLTATW